MTRDRRTASDPRDPSPFLRVGSDGPVFVQRRRDGLRSPTQRHGGEGRGGNAAAPTSITEQIVEGALEIFFGIHGACGLWRRRVVSGMLEGIDAVDDIAV